jgi:hypothetical protein
VKNPSGRVEKYNPARRVVGDTLTAPMTDTFFRWPPSPPITGVFPFNAHDRRTRGLRNSPDSSIRTRWAFCRRTFFSRPANVTG